MSVPLVSVILPVRNAAPFLEIAVGSILGQTLHDLELIVIDDGSSDDTPQVLERLRSQDSRLRIETADGKGLVAALNQGCGLARASLLARMDADDRAAPERLAIQVALLQRDARVGVVGSAVTVVDETGRHLYRMRYPTTDAAIRSALLTGSAFAHPTVVMRREHLERAGGYRPAFLHAEDYDLWLRMAEVCRLANHPEPILDYLLQPHQISLEYLEQQLISTVGARVSARARQAGAPDRLSSAPRVTRELLIDVGMPMRQLGDELLEGVAAQALFLCVVGRPHQARTLLKWASGQSGLSSSARAQARILIVTGMTMWMVGQPGLGLKQVARGSLLDVPYALDFARKAVRGRFSLSKRTHRAAS